MSDRTQRAVEFLQTWDPDQEVLPDWVADALDEDPSLASKFDARFVPWDGGELGARTRAPVAARRPRRWALPIALLAATLLGTFTVGGFGVAAVLRSYQTQLSTAPTGHVRSSPTGVESVEVTPSIRVDPRDPFGEGPRERVQIVSGKPVDVPIGGEVGWNAEASNRGRRTGTPDEALSSQLVARGERTSETNESSRSGFFGYDGEADKERSAGLDGHHRVVIDKAAIQIKDSVLFHANGVTPPEEAGPLLDAVADVLREHPDLGKLVIEGHAEGQGQESQAMSEQRARGVRLALIDRGVSPHRLDAVGFGETRPIAPIGTAEGRAANARVEFRIESEPLGAVDPLAIEDYTDYGHQAFVRASDDPLSTFSIDVDTASYAITRQKLVEGWLPPAAAVRVEEFVNAFPYDYHKAPEGAPFGVDAEGVPSPFNPRTELVRIGVQGRRIATDQRQPVHLTFLIDTSGSMQSDDKMGLAKQSLEALVGELEDGDTVAIVAYAGSAGLVLPPTPMSRKTDILRALDQLQTGGSTAMGDGIQLAYRQAEATYRAGAVNRVVLLSDGDANVGATNHEDLVQMVRGYADRGIGLTTAGFGTGNYNDTTMERLANDGDGNYFYIDSIDEGRRVFVDRLTSTLVDIARDVKIQVEWNPETVEAYRLVGYENRDIADRDFRNDAVDAGEIGAGHTVTALYEVALREGADGRLGTVRIRSKPPGPDAPALERTYTLDAEVMRDTFPQGSPDLRLAVAAASFAELLRGSPHLHGASYADVAKIAREAQRPEYDEDRELISLIDRAHALSRMQHQE